MDSIHSSLPTVNVAVGKKIQIFVEIVKIIVSIYLDADAAIVN